MTNRHLLPPRGLLIAIPILLVVAAIFTPLITSVMPPEQYDRAILLQAVPFLAVFIAILLAFISFIFVMANLLNNNVRANVHRTIELTIIGGIFAGLLGMFQPFAIELYQLGFLLLLLSTLGFIVWSHITPRYG
ncbi:MAG: hypothetical protein HZC41_02795 [Chloroflexi bacterium]|nr:hypothetical protein [Chloroflexota bacterium]